MIRFTLFGAPRTKKTHNRIFRFGKDREHTRVAPSEQFEDYLSSCLMQGLVIRGALEAAGIVLPIFEAVSVRALFYRQRNDGDATGYYSALGDIIQAPTMRVDKKTGRIKTARKGIGIINDDRLIHDWDGSRLLKDAKCPRVEVELNILTGKWGHPE